MGFGKTKYDVLPLEMETFPGAGEEIADDIDRPDVQNCDGHPDQRPVEGVDQSVAAVFPVEDDHQDHDIQHCQDHDDPDHPHIGE